MSIQIHLELPDGSTRSLSAAPGQSLLTVALDAGIEGIAAECGGVVSCATCHVIVDPEWADRLEAPDSDELEMLAMTAAPREPTSRLACQINLEPALDGIRVRLPVRQY